MAGERQDMKQAIIDIGSNSIRLTLYEITGDDFRILFKEKRMTGLAGYVDDGVLSEEGIRRACHALAEFRATLETLEIENVRVFATASLRNIDNTVDAVNEIRENPDVGFDIEILRGEEEALFGYLGAMREANVPSGAFMDIGGASSEVVTFENGSPVAMASFHLGALNLYRSCVKQILPRQREMKKLNQEILLRIDESHFFQFTPHSPLVCVGGTARAVLKLAKRKFGLGESATMISSEQFYELSDLLYSCSREALDLILKLEPDRVHTIIPGVMIMRHFCDLFEAEQIIVCKYGVREGYLCQKVLNNTFTPRTAN